MERGHRLKEIAGVIGGTLHLVGKDERITHLSIDTRKPFPVEGTLFIALSGKHHDGNHYVKNALEQGVRNVLLNDASIAKDLAANTLLVDDTLSAMQRLCAWHRAQFNCPVIGITGSNGKTIVKEWLYQLLRGTEHIVRSPGSWNSQVGVPLSVWEMGAEHTLGIFEAGISEPREMERLAPIIAPTIGVFTNIGPAHGEHFASDRQKAEEKAKLFVNANVSVYCRDHAVVHEALRTSTATLRDWSRTSDAFMRVVREETEGIRSHVRVRIAGEEHPFLIPFNDAASVENALHCITLLLHLGHVPAWINERLAQLTPVEMRLRTMAGAHDTTLIDDSYSSDLASFGLALDHLVRISGGRERVVVTSDIVESGEKPAQLYRKMADLIHHAGCGRVFAIGPSITAHKHLFGDDAHFFAITEDLLSQVTTEELNGTVVLVKGARSFGLERVVERWQESTHGTVLGIDLDALRHNLNHYRSALTPNPVLDFARTDKAKERGAVRVMAMVKAFGYGSGAVELARLFEHEHVHYLGVAYADEGADLRQNGVRTPVLVMNPEPVPLDLLHRFQLETEVYDQRSLRASIDFAKHVPGAPPVHIKLDTGMHRLGFIPEEIPTLLDALRDCGSLRVASIFSHLAASEDPQHDAFTRMQIVTFTSIADRINEVLGYAPLRHIANSAAATRFPEARMDMVRLGIGLHGIGADAQETAKLLPVASLRTVIAQVKTIPAGDSIGYGRSFIAARDMRIAILPIGYADGLLRRLGNGVGKVWIQGKPAPFVGSICMDLCMVDVTEIDCAAGGDALIFGGAHPVQDYACDLGTIPYEALTSISQRVKRVYTHG